MRKLLVLMVLGLAFIACDYAKESVELNPDIEITWVNPLGAYVTPADVDTFVSIDEVDFVNENSIDCYLREFICEYCDAASNTPFYTCDPLPLYAKVEGIVERPYVDTVKILNLALATGPAVDHMVDNGTHSVKALLKFVYSDEYMDQIDTATAWFGFYLFDTTSSF